MNASFGGVYLNTAKKQIKKLPKKKQLKILRKIGKIKKNPCAGKKLKGFSKLRSVRVWPYRIILKDKSLFINVVEHRQKLYTPR